MKRIFSFDYESGVPDLHLGDYISKWTRSRSYYIDNEEAVQAYWDAEEQLRQARVNLVKAADANWWNHVFPFRHPEYQGDGMTEAVSVYPELSLPAPDKEAILDVLRRCANIREIIEDRVLFRMLDLLDEYMS